MPRLILYACPTGPLAEQLAAFYQASRERCGPNAAHAYPAHITLTGFFHDEAAAIPRYLAAAGRAHAAALAARPERPLRVRELRLAEDFHGLLIDSPWLEWLSGGFAARAAAPASPDPLRVKGGLHLSLAYGFAPEQCASLAELARAMVDPQAPAGWELRLYERGEGWLAHGAWPL